jgi:hypothetical protein
MNSLIDQILAADTFHKFKCGRQRPSMLQGMETSRRHVRSCYPLRLLASSNDSPHHFGEAWDDRAHILPTGRRSGDDTCSARSVQPFVASGNEKITPELRKRLTLYPETMDSIHHQQHFVILVAALVNLR